LFIVMLIAHEKRYKLQASVKRPASNLNATSCKQA
jgi:hypothetical protein